jgi:hypothetical protein
VKGGKTGKRVFRGYFSGKCFTIVLPLVLPQGKKVKHLVTKRTKYGIYEQF